MTRPERDALLAKLREAIKQADDDHRYRRCSRLPDYEAMAEAAFDTLVEAWFPPF
ncbi:hypothetical protein SEA_JALFARM20_95 [Mycobacterium phage JalFarm20]|nr:hypothetical protein SEA_JALFARM20_95 [Mycobacterium phage JalFarm20]